MNFRHLLGCDTVSFSKPTFESSLTSSHAVVLIYVASLNLDLQGQLRFSFSYTSFVELHEVFHKNLLGFNSLNHSLSVNKMEFTEEAPQFSEPFERSDQVLVVERHEFHVHRFILAFSSPVFLAMFNNNGFIEAVSDKIDLPGKKANLFKEFLVLLYSPYDLKLEVKDNLMSDDVYQSVFDILEYIREYQADKALHVMDMKLQEYISKVKDKTSIFNSYMECKFQAYMRIAHLTDHFKLKRASDDVVLILKYFPFTLITSHEMFNLLSLDMKNHLIMKTACALEESFRRIIGTGDIYREIQPVLRDINELQYKTHRILLKNP